MVSGGDCAPAMSELHNRSANEIFFILVEVVVYARRRCG
jgi:hypothetical protein